MSRTLFGILIAIVVLLFIYLAYVEVSPGISGGNWVSYVEALFFLAALVGVVLAGMNLIRAKRR